MPTVQDAITRLQRVEDKTQSLELHYDYEHHLLYIDAAVLMDGSMDDVTPTDEVGCDIH